MSLTTGSPSNCHGFAKSDFAVEKHKEAQHGGIAMEPREAFGVRGACSRFRIAQLFTTAPASRTHSNRSATHVRDPQGIPSRAALEIGLRSSCGGSVILCLLCLFAATIRAVPIDNPRRARSGSNAVRQGQVPVWRAGWRCDCPPCEWSGTRCNPRPHPEIARV